MFVETEDVKKHMKVLDVGTISKNLGEYYSSFAQEMKHNWHDMWEEQVFAPRFFLIRKLFKIQTLKIFNINGYYDLTSSKLDIHLIYSPPFSYWFFPFCTLFVFSMCTSFASSHL